MYGVHSLVDGEFPLHRVPFSLGYLHARSDSCARTRFFTDVSLHNDDD